MSIPENERKAPKTIQHNLELFRGFLHWATNLGYIFMGWTRFLHSNQRNGPWTPRYSGWRRYRKDSQVSCIYDWCRCHPSHFWVLLIVLFSATRLEEISCLEVNDWCIEDDDDIPCFNIHRKGDSKNTNSIFTETTICFNIYNKGNRWLKIRWINRLVPIHPLLFIELNIMACVSSIKNREKVLQLFAIQSYTNYSFLKLVNLWYVSLSDTRTRGQTCSRFGICRNRIIQEISMKWLRRFLTMWTSLQ